MATNIICPKNEAKLPPKHESNKKQKSNRQNSHIANTNFLKVMTLNFGGKGSTKERWGMVETIITNNKPNIIFYQEFNGTDLKNCAQKAGYDDPCSTNEAESEEGKKQYRKNGILVEKNLKNQNVTWNEHEKPDGRKRIKRRYATMDLRLEEECRILLVSYHGVHNANQKEKKHDLVMLSEIVKQTIESSKYNYNGYIIGGDFNLASEKAQRCISSIVYDYECHKDRPGTQVIDYFVAAGVTLCGIHVESLPALNHGEEGPSGEKPLDHLPVFAWIDKDLVKGQDRKVFNQVMETDQKSVQQQIQDSELHGQSSLNVSNVNVTQNEGISYSSEERTIRLLEKIQTNQGEMASKQDEIIERIDYLEEKVDEIAIMVENEIVKRSTDSITFEYAVLWRREQLDDLKVIINRPMTDEMEMSFQNLQHLLDEIDHSKAKRLGSYRADFKLKWLEESRPLLAALAIHLQVTDSEKGTKWEKDDSQDDQV